MGSSVSLTEPYSLGHSLHLPNHHRLRHPLPPLLEGVQGIGMIGGILDILRNAFFV